MRQLTANELRIGMKVELDHDPYAVVGTEFVKPGKGQAFCRIKIKNLMTGRVVEKTFKSTEKIDIADVYEARMRLLYTEVDGAVFMDDETFEQTTIASDIIGENRQWMKDDTLYEIIFYQGTAIEVIPPTFMELKITKTDPGVRGDTASGRVLKPSTVETGAKIQIPIFIEEGETIKVDTRTGEYVCRVGS